MTDPSPHNVERFLELETEIWSALVSGDASADARLLADEFLCVFGGGFCGKADHVGQLHDGPLVAEYDLTDARIQVLAPDVVLLAYRARWVLCRGDGRSESMYVSSIWRRDGDRWSNVFSQDTPAIEPDRAASVTDSAE